MLPPLDEIWPDMFREKRAAPPPASLDAPARKPLDPCEFGYRLSPELLTACEFECANAAEDGRSGLPFELSAASLTWRLCDADLRLVVWAARLGYREGQAVRG